MQAIAVDCVFEESGKVRVRRVRLAEKWQAVEQGRQWQDEGGRHVLVMSAGGRIMQIALNAQTLRWELSKAHDAGRGLV